MPISKSNISVIPAKRFRPIAVTSCGPKLKIRAVLSRLISSVSVLDDPLPFVYKSNRSTWAIVVFLVHNIPRSLDVSAISLRCVLLDFSLLFDSVPQSLFLRKLEQLDCPSCLLVWLSD